MSERGQSVARGFVWFVLAVVCAPLVPPLVVARALWRRSRGTLRPSRLAFMTTPGRWIFWSVAFVGSEGVALDVFANAYFNSVDEHAAGIVGALVIGVLGLILFADLVLRGTIDVARKVATRA